MLNNEQPSNYWNFVARNATGLDDREEIEKAKIEYVEMCMYYANDKTTEDLKVFNWIIDRYPKYHSRFLPYFFNIAKHKDSWKISRTPLWEFLCGELIKSYNSLRFDSDLTYLASCAIMEQIRLIESEGYEFTEDDNTFLLELPIQYILFRMTKIQKTKLASSLYGFSNFRLQKDNECNDYYLEMVDY